MTAFLNTPVNTSYQRIILQVLQDSFANWFFSFNGKTMWRSNLFAPDFELVFHGNGLGQDAAGNLTGSISRIEINDKTGAAPVQIADIKRLSIVDANAFFQNSLLLDPNAVNFTQAPDTQFWNDVTPASIEGSSGDDRIETAPGGTNVFAGAGNDVVVLADGGGGSHEIRMGAGKKDAVDLINLSNNITLDMGAGTATAADGSTWSVSGARYFFGTNFNDALTGSGGKDHIFGRAGADVISGLGANDRLHGDAGNDTIDGGDGDDDIFGEADNDSLLGDLGNDKLSGGDGNDTLTGGAGDDSLYGGKLDDLLDGSSGNDWLIGNGGADTLKGGTGLDRMAGGRGNDKFFAGAGNDFVDGGPGRDTVFGGGDDDGLVGSTGNDKIYGGPGNDTLNGEIGNDFLSGGPGGDQFDDDSGNDTMRGGAGADNFMFGATAQGADAIVDFEVGLDKIHISPPQALGFAITPVGGTPGDFLVTYLPGTITVTVTDPLQTLSLSDFLFDL